MYDFWFGFRSWREFPHEDEEETEQAECREEKRYIHSLNRPAIVNFNNVNGEIRAVHANEDQIRLDLGNWRVIMTCKSCNLNTCKIVTPIFDVPSTPTTNYQSPSHCCLDSQVDQSQIVANVYCVWDLFRQYLSHMGPDRPDDFSRWRKSLLDWTGVEMSQHRQTLDDLHISTSFSASTSSGPIDPMSGLICSNVMSHLRRYQSSNHRQSELYQVKLLLKIFNSNI